MKNRHSLKDWLIATRPWSFPASSMPVLVTLFYLQWIGERVNWGLGLWALLIVVLFNAGADAWSDYSDYKKGVDREDNVGSLSITSGKFRPHEIRNFALCILAVAFFSGIAIMLFTGLPTLYLGLAACVLVFAYPWMKYHALGDIDIFLTFTFLPVLGITFVATGHFVLTALWITIPLGLITEGIEHANHTRDIEQDRRAGICTFAMLVAIKTSSYLYSIFVMPPFVSVAPCSVYGIFPMWALLVLLALKPAADNSRRMLRAPAEGMKVLSGGDEVTAKMHLLFSLLMVAAFVIDMQLR